MSWYIHVKLQDCNTIQEWNTRYLLSLTKPFTSLHETPSVGGFPPTSRWTPAPVSGTGPGAWRPLRNYRMMISGKIGRKRAPASRHGASWCEAIFPTSNIQIFKLILRKNPVKKTWISMTSKRSVSLWPVVCPPVSAKPAPPELGIPPEWPKISGNSGPVPKMGGIPHLYIL